MYETPWPDKSRFGEIVSHHLSAKFLKKINENKPKLPIAKARRASALLTRNSQARTQNIRSHSTTSGQTCASNKDVEPFMVLNGKKFSIFLQCG